MRRLTAQEIQQYHRDGYIQVDNIFPLGELAEIDGEIDRLRRSFIVSYQDAQAVRGNKDQHKILKAA